MTHLSCLLSTKMFFFSNLGVLFFVSEVISSDLNLWNIESRLTKLLYSLPGEDLEEYGQSGLSDLW